MLTITELASRLQYTNVQADATREQIIAHCHTAADCAFHAVMLQPCWVPLARDILHGAGVRIASAIAYPLGGETTAMKVALARELVRIGADEFDFQPNIGFLLSGMEREFEDEIRAVVAAAQGIPVKSMSEFGFLTDEQKIRCLRLSEEAGVAYVKNSSGVGPGGSPASPDVILFMRTHLAERTLIKASGRIRSREQAEALLAAGAHLLGTSAAPHIVGLVADSTASY